MQSLPSLDEKAWWEGNAQNFCVSYSTVAAMHFTDQSWILKIVYCIGCVMVCKIGFTNWNAKIALLRASMVVTYYIKLFRTGSDRHNGILMSLLLLVAETIMINKVSLLCKLYNCKSKATNRICKPNNHSTKENS